MLLSEIQRAELDPPTKSFEGDSLLTLMLVDAAMKMMAQQLFEVNECQLKRF